MSASDLVILVDLDGTTTSLATDTLPPGSLGPATVRRASDVEFEHGQWTVRIGGVPVFRHARRDDCLAWERQELNPLLGKGVVLA